MASGIRDITSAAGLNESVLGDEVVLVYFGFGAKSAENPHSLGDEFDPQFEEFAESGEVVPKLFRAVFSDVTAQFFADVGIDPMCGGSLVLWKQGDVLAKASVKELNESSDIETEVVRWLAGKYPSKGESAKARPARPSSAVPARAQVAGPTPGSTCGAPPPGPPPPPSGNPSMATGIVFGAALSGPPPGPKSAVPGQTPGAMCGAPPLGPPPSGPRTPGQPTTMTVGAALSGPPPGPKAPLPPSEPLETALPPPPPPPAPPQEDCPPPPPTPANEPVPIKHPETPCPVPPPVPKADSGDRTQSQPAPTPPAELKASTSPTPVAKQAPVTLAVQSPVVCEDKDANIAKGKHVQTHVEKAPLPPADLGSGLQACEAAPEPPNGLGVAVADSPPTDDVGERIAKLFASHGKHGTVNRDTMKALLQFLLTKQGSRKGLVPAQLDRIVDTFIEESDSGNCINANQFIQWVWSGAKSRQ